MHSGTKLSGWLRHCIQYIKFYLGTPAPKTSNHISTNAFQYCTFSYSILHTFPSILEKCAILHAKIGRTKIDKTSIFLYISFQLKILIFLYDFDSTTQGPRKIDNCGGTCTYSYIVFTDYKTIDFKRN